MQPGLKITLALIALITVMSGGTSGCAINPVTGGQDVVFMSEQQEIAIGRQTHQQVLDAFGVYDDPDLQDYITRIGERLAAGSHRPELIYRFTLLDSKQINAFALPGGYIYITRGMLAYLNDEASLAAVIGHEIGHVTARHSVRQHGAAQMAGIGATLAAILVPGMNTPAAGQMVNILGNAMLSGYGREHELEADRLGAEYMARAGYDPQRILDVLGLLKSQEQYAQELARIEGREPGTYHGLFASHPDNDTRLQEVVATANAVRVSGEPFIGRDEFLALIDGLTFGDSAREGIIRGRNFYHGEMGFALRFPNDWRINNQPNQVVAMAPGGGALLVLQAEDLGKRVSPREYLLERLRPQQLTDEREFRINGLPAYSMRTQTRTESGVRPVRYTVVYLNDMAYVIAGASRDAANAEQLVMHDQAFVATAASFHALTENEQLLATPLRLKITTAEAGMNYRDLAAASPLEHLAEAQLRLLNAAYPDKPLITGEAIKIVN
ncbi:MAG: M48 family metalloprotease [Gammaproteobacteria bacterium]